MSRLIVDIKSLSILTMLTRLIVDIKSLSILTVMSRLIVDIKCLSILTMLSRLIVDIKSLSILTVQSLKFCNFSVICFTGRYLDEMGITPANTKDRSGCNRFQQYNLNYVMGPHTSALPTSAHSLSSQIVSPSVSVFLYFY
jgi:hypothetical protein